MRLRVHIEFSGLDQVRITKFSGSKTIDVKDIKGGKAFDFDSSTIVDQHREKTDFCLTHWQGDGTLEEPYVLIVQKRDYDTGIMEIEEMIGARSDDYPREITIEKTIV